MKAMRNFVYQGDEDSCGLASLKTLLLDLTKKKGYRYYRPDTEKPLNLEEIRRLAWKEGVNIEWKKALSKKDIVCCETFPLLAMLEGENKGHLVYLKKGTKKKILVLDPASGPKWYLREELAKKFSLIYGEVSLISNEKCIYKKPKIIRPISMILPCITSFVGIAFLFASLLFIGDEKTHLFAAICLALYGVFTILSRFVSSRFSKSFDKKWLKHVPSMDKKKLARNYERYYTFKSHVFPAMTTLLESVCSVFGIMFVFGMNDPFFCLAGLSLAVYLFVESQCYRKKQEKEKCELSLKEEDLFDATRSKKEQMKLIGEINDKASKIGENTTYARVIYLAVIGFLSIMSPLINENVSLNCYLFQFFGLVGLGQAIRSLFYFFETKVIRERAFIYFCDNFANKESSRFKS